MKISKNQTVEYEMPPKELLFTLSHFLYTDPLNDSSKAFSVEHESPFVKTFQLFMKKHGASVFLPIVEFRGNQQR